MEHIAVECPALHEVRFGDHRLKQIVSDLKDLPTSLHVYGWAPPFAADITETHWDKSHTNLQITEAP